MSRTIASKSVAVQAMPQDLGADRLVAGRRAGLGDGLLTVFAFRQAELVEALFREAEPVRVPARVIDDVEDGEDRTAVHRNFDLGQALELLRAIKRAVAREIGDVLVDRYRWRSGEVSACGRFLGRRAPRAEP